MRRHAGLPPARRRRQPCLFVDFVVGSSQPQDANVCCYLLTRVCCLFNVLVLKMSDKSVNYYKVFKTAKSGLKLNVDGFIYENNRKTSDKFYWACECRRNKTYQCNSRIVTSLHVKTGMHSIVRQPLIEHNHEPDALREKIANLINNLKEEALRNPVEKTSSIIEKFFASTPPDILPHLPSSNVLRQIIYRQKNKQTDIVEPQNENFEINLDFLKSSDIEDFVLIDKELNNKRVVLFTTNQLLHYLSDSKFWLMEGNFKLPAKLLFQHLYVIYGCVRDIKTFPLVFVLFANKDELTYDAIFQILKEHCDSIDISLSPRYMITDFEKALSVSAEKHFKNVVLKGWNFHLGRMIYQQIKECGYQKLYGNKETFAVEMKSIFALSYLPAEELPICFDEWSSDVSPEARTIADWFSDNYIWGTSTTSMAKYDPTFWSIHELYDENIPQVQNSAEVWHNKIQSLLSNNNTAFYRMSNQIINEIKIITAEIDKLTNDGEQSAKKQKTTEKWNCIANTLNNKSQYNTKTLLDTIANIITLL